MSIITQNELAKGIIKGYRIGSAFFRSAVNAEDVPTEIPLWFGGQLISWLWAELKPENRCKARAVAFWRQHGAMRDDIGEIVEIKRSGYSYEESLKQSYDLQTQEGTLKIAIPVEPEVYVRVKYADGEIVEARLSDFDLLP